MEVQVADLKNIQFQQSFAAVDQAVCTFLADRDPDASDEVLLAAALVSYKYRQGDVCLELQQESLDTLIQNFEDISMPASAELLQKLINSALVGSPGDYKPLILENDERLYFHKLWNYEEELAQNILAKAAKKEHELDNYFPKEMLDQLFVGSKELNWQKVAAVSSLLNSLTVISGGPGTGKTTTVVRILALLYIQAKNKGDNLSVALAAPTGKAASRLKLSLSQIKSNFGLSKEILELMPDDAYTIHQLLGARRHTSKFKYDQDNPLPFDVIIVDEASMIDQALMSKLMNAMLEDTKLILLGDKDQLSSVEAGSVLGNICSVSNNQITKERAQLLAGVSQQIPGEHITGKPAPLTDNIILLQENYRFKEGSGIAMFSEEIKNGDLENALSILQNPSLSDISLQPISTITELNEMLVQFSEHYMNELANCESISDFFKVYASRGILAAHRKGPYGVEFLNTKIEQHIKRLNNISAYQEWYVGRPVMISNNDYRLGLFNGDIGICRKDDSGEYRIYFEKEGAHISLAPSRLRNYDIAYTLTIHKSQGSEFDSVILLLPDSDSRLLSRELLYTGITRARNEVHIVGSEEVLKTAVTREIKRSSGLKHKIWKP